MIHYDVQLMGGAALHKGKIAEMMTGEGNISRYTPCLFERPWGKVFTLLL